MTEAGDITIATYQANALTYREQTSTPGPATVAFLDAFAALVVRPGHVLELGSGPGLGALQLEGRGLRVSRTDATPAFVEMMRADGHEARLLDARRDPLGGPYDAVVADAVLLHLDRAVFEDLLRRARDAVTDDAVLAMTLKEGDGTAWTDAKLGGPRHFTYWREGPLREVLERAGWTVTSLEHVQGRIEPWLYLLARAAARPGALDLPRLSDGEVLLRAWSDDDVALVVETSADAQIPRNTTVPSVPDPSAARAFIARQHRRAQTRAGYSFAIADARTGTAVGQLGVWIDELPKGRVHLGYWVVASQRGHGIAARALTLALRWALTLPGVHRLELYVEPWNEASWRTAERAGFVREGLLRRWEPVAGEARDMYMYALVPGTESDARPGDAVTTAQPE